MGQGLGDAPASFADSRELTDVGCRARGTDRATTHDRFATHARVEPTTRCSRTVDDWADRRSTSAHVSATPTAPSAGRAASAAGPSADTSAGPSAAGSSADTSTSSTASGSARDASTHSSTAAGPARDASTADSTGPAARRSRVVVDAVASCVRDLPAGVVRGTHRAVTPEEDGVRRRRATAPEGRDREENARFNPHPRSIAQPRRRWSRRVGRSNRQSTRVSESGRGVVVGAAAWT